MKCPNPHCKAENPDEATFCRACGRKFMFIDKYSDFKFIQVKKGAPWPFALYAAFIKLALFLLLIISLSLTIYFWFSWFNYDSERQINSDNIEYYIITDKSHKISSSDYHYWSWENEDNYNEALKHYHSELLDRLVPVGIATFIFLLLLFFNRKVKLSKKCLDKSLYDIADYITHEFFIEYCRLWSSHTYALFVKGDKFGIIDITDRSIYVQSLYEDAKKIGRFVCLKHNGLWCLLEYKIPGTPRMITNARFQNISKVDSANSLFQVTENGRTFIIDKYGKELK